MNLSHELSNRLSNGIIDAQKMDLVNHYGYTMEQVNNMTESEINNTILFYSEPELFEEDDQTPPQFKNEKCECGGKLNFFLSDSESIGIKHVAECTDCNEFVEFFESFVD